MVACLILALWMIHLPGRPYDRETLKFGEIKPTLLNVTGAWTGSWTDPRRDYKEIITFNLEQSGNTISGTIHSVEQSRVGFKKPYEWDVIDGHISGDRINLYYGRRDFRKDITATLLGVCKQDEMSGEYFGHVAAKVGFSSKGIWQVHRVQP